MVSNCRGERNGTAKGDINQYHHSHVLYFANTFKSSDIVRLDCHYFTVFAEGDTFTPGGGKFLH